MAMKENDILCPDFFIAGFAKTASMSLYRALHKHPYINMGKWKEPLTFARDYHWADIDRVYRRNYGMAKGLRPTSLLGDCNINNAHVLYVPERIKLANPNAKIIFIVRDPVEQVYSRWKYNRMLRPGFENSDFSAAVMEGIANFNLNRFESEEDYVPTMCRRWGNYYRQYIECGCYDYYISHWENYFNDLLIVNYHCMIDEPQYTFNMICTFLEVPFKEIKFPHANEGMKFDQSHHKELDRLQLFYEPWNIKMQERGIYFV